MKREFSAGVVIYHIHGYERYYLLIKSTKGHWSFAKGKIEKGETKEEAALREVTEETGLTVTIDNNFAHDVSYNYTEKNELTHKTVYFFAGEAKDMNITLSHEHVDYQWLVYKNALTTLTYKTDKTVLESAELFLKKHKK
jgi:bis(5'-nucleosidyl)-tetraphosphatase